MTRQLCAAAVLAFVTLATGASGRLLLQSDTTTVRWYEPANGRLNDVSVPVNGAVRFQWERLHDLWEVPSLNCPDAFRNGSGIQQLSPQTTSGSYTVQFNESGTRYFACSVGDHCEDGQLIAVRVGSGPAPAPGPSSRYRGGSSNNYNSDGQPQSEYGGSNYGEEEEEEGYGSTSSSGYGSTTTSSNGYGSG